ncbi:MAG TPA: type II toxin-antitoxin system prevent-host-death family antitoxin [Gaiellaceae bacterium]|jgi:prevent-host-death family protein|nr:type II toxin-antitoxin system prevent-host-death family antitoxin [Gaiellaceae bacterium]
MNVGIRELRAQLSRYIERVESGEELTVTDRGRPVARIVPANGRTRLDELIASGLVQPAPRPITGKLPPPLETRGRVSDLVRDKE